MPAKHSLISRLTRETSFQITAEIRQYFFFNPCFTVSLVSPYTVWMKIHPQTEEGVHSSSVCLCLHGSDMDYIFVGFANPGAFNHIDLKLEDDVTVSIQNGIMTIVITTKEEVELCYVFTTKMVKLQR